MPEILSVADVDTPIGRLKLATSEKGLAHLTLPHASGRGLAGWIASHSPGAVVRQAPEPSQLAAQQVLEYLEGERIVFELALDLRGTEFQLATFDQIAAIAYGEKRSYGELAEELGSAPRAVGTAAGANPLPLVVPCHRVVGRGGHLTGYTGGVDLQGRLLAMERARAGTRADRLF